MILRSRAHQSRIIVNNKPTIAVGVRREGRISKQMFGCLGSSLESRFCKQRMCGLSLAESFGVCFKDQTSPWCLFLKHF